MLTAAPNAPTHILPDPGQRPTLEAQTDLDAENDSWQRFQHYGIPPRKQGDCAYLLHILRSLKSIGKGACILPHGVLFRGGAEGVIRRNLVRRGYLKGIIGLPPNLFYGTGIPACIVIRSTATLLSCWATSAV